ncbi:hypothetical protein NRIC_03810 [Enterococcus florum]|uniref:Terminase n=1 Tax=Enterococcus florum TaxID=2480627 RepID=A0A4P5P4D9_9ENTE|nr:hypothetical protein [Enterococcus florum]GCF92490.1 hypothetical protein NRIC_03810 [Enterococcus florum]
MAETNITYNEAQKRVIRLLDNATPKSQLIKWGVGYIPDHYKRLSISMKEAIKLAILGAKDAKGYFGTDLFFTQALLYGAVISGKYKTFIVVTPSQYGKSWLCGQIAIRLADDRRQMYVAGGNSSTTDIIMSKVIAHIQTVDSSVKNKMLETADKIERLQTAMSKRKLAFKGGGSIESISLGEAFNDPKQGNAAIGRGGDYIIDEASMISDDVYAELGRREFANVTGEKYISFEISNPHNPGRFFDKLTNEHVPEDSLIVWMDARTAYEEGRIISKKQVTESTFFAHKSTCIRYLLCELEDYSESSLFNPVEIDDSELDRESIFFLGVDSAYKGKDGIEAVLCALESNGKVRVFDKFSLKKENWIDGVTSKEIISELLGIIKAYDVQMVCIDVGKGIWLVEGLSQYANGFSVKGIDFGSGTTKVRKEAKHYAAVYGFNKRAEIHMDLADLIDNQKVSFTKHMYESMRDQMNAVKGIRKGDGAKTAIIPKDEIKAIIGKSPDELDATLLSIHAVILYSLTQGAFIYQ